MLSHFEWRPLYQTDKIPGWSISFYHSNKRYQGIYHKDGSISWTSAAPEADSLEEIESRVHELMLYHVYDNQ